MGALTADRGISLWHEVYFPVIVSLLLSSSGIIAIAGDDTGSINRGIDSASSSSSVNPSFTSELTSLLDFGYPDALCGSWHNEYIQIHEQIRAASRNAAGSSVNAGGSNSSSAIPLRFITYEWFDNCGGLGDSLLGLASTFAVALITRRAFIIRHPCIPFAFEPNLVDWTASDDVPMEPAREIAMDRIVARVAAWEGLQAADEVPMVDMRNLFFVDLAFFFLPFQDAINMRLSWNRGELTELLTEEQGPWGEWIRATGLRVPYAIGCILRVLLKPKPEVMALLSSLWGQTHAPDTVSIGVHVRIQDETAWQGETKLRPKEYNSTELQELLGKAAPVIDCAQSVETWWFPPPLRVRWVLITNSGRLKDALKQQLPDKVLFTTFVPRHSEKLGDIVLRERGFNHFVGNASDAVLLHDYAEAAVREASARSADPSQVNDTRIHEEVLAKLTAEGRLAGSINRGAEEEGDNVDEAERKSAAVMNFQEMVAEWLLLSTCHSFVLPESGFSRSAALYSLRPMSIFFYQRCDPEAPEKLTDMASSWSKV
ncbi:hypothetical protein CLOM_g15538 [Closterium sp. NIES-68]|nr:hypothetical protein CLOM_g15538 [Closterium sp. NIES-68]GJP59023.1 hypothetical protein CLOP_g7081 [Closterium sp. NIES-67]